MAECRQTQQFAAFQPRSCRNRQRDEETTIACSTVNSPRQVADMMSTTPLAIHSGRSVATHRSAVAWSIITTSFNAQSSSNAHPRGIRYARKWLAAGSEAFGARPSARREGSRCQPEFNSCCPLDIDRHPFPFPILSVSKTWATACRHASAVATHPRLESRNGT